MISRIGVVAKAASNFDGVSVNIHQSNNVDDANVLFDKVLRACDNHSLRLMFELNTATFSEAGRLLDKLSTSLATNPNNPDLVIFRAPSGGTGIEATLRYLRDVLPLTAQFLESHPTIGSSYGRLNSHGNALNNHVIGACHHFPHQQVPQLAGLLDVYLPTRLALSSQHELMSAATPKHDLEAVVQNTDVLFIDESEDDKSAWLLSDEVWRAQQLDGAKETYAVCQPLDDEGHQLAERIRRRFLDCTSARGMPSTDAVGVDHVVMLKLKPDVTEDQIVALKKAASTLTEIDGVVSVTGGYVFVEDWMQDRRGDAAINYGIRVRLASKGDLKVYQSHALHVKVIKENIAPLLAGPVVAFDWESDEAK